MKAEPKAICERADDLLGYLYGEASEAEAQAFELHLKQCGSCKADLSSFGQVRQSVATWRDEVLDGFVAAPLELAPRRKSAIAALKGFFDLSPFWMKGAAALLTVLFCVLAVNTVRELGKQMTIEPTPIREGLYTKVQVDDIVSKALAQQAVNAAVKPTEAPKVAVNNPPERKRSNRSLSNTGQEARGRRPLSRSEREQLAADLRLLATQDDGGLSLLGDRINQ
jgi:hypothetical protein